MNSFLDNKICPICQIDNACQVEEIQKCWCFQTSIPKVLIELVSKEPQNKSCICQKCVELFKKDELKFRKTYLRY